jgi:hypothetical protein
MSLPTYLPQSSRDVLTLLSAAEVLAEEILSHKRDLIEIDRRRHDLMQAKAQFRPNKAHADAAPNIICNNFNKSFVNCGAFFIELPNESVLAAIEQDQKAIDGQINETKAKIKDKLKKMQKINPSEMEPGLVEFVLRESEREKNNKLFDIREEELDNTQQLLNLQ